MDSNAALTSVYEDGSGVETGSKGWQRELEKTDVYGVRLHGGLKMMRNVGDERLHYIHTAVKASETLGGTCSLCQGTV